RGADALLPRGVVGGVRRLHDLRPPDPGRPLLVHAPPPGPPALAAFRQPARQVHPPAVTVLARPLDALAAGVLLLAVLVVATGGFTVRGLPINRPEDLLVVLATVVALRGLVAPIALPRVRPASSLGVRRHTAGGGPRAPVPRQPVAPRHQHPGHPPAGVCDRLPCVGCGGVRRPALRMVRARALAHARGQGGRRDRRRRLRSLARAGAPALGPRRHGTRRERPRSPHRSHVGHAILPPQPVSTPRPLQ